MDPSPSNDRASNDGQAPTKRLRIGLLLDANENLFWVHEIIALIKADPDLELCVVAYNRGTNAIITPRPSFWHRLVKNRFLYNRFPKLERWKDQDALAPYAKRDVSQLVEGIPALDIHPEQGRYADRFSEADVDRLESYRPDILFRFGFRILRGRILDLPRYGVWSYHHGDSEKYRGGPPGFWELVNGEPVSGVTLQVLSNTLDGGRVLATLSRRTHPVSAELNYVGLCESGIALFQYAINRLRHRRPSKEEFLNSLALPDLENSRIYRTPGNLPMLKYISRRAGHHLRSRLGRRRQTVQWSIALIPGNRWESVLDGPPEKNWLLPDGTRFYADPFLLSHATGLYLFFEEYLYETGRAHISVAKVNETRDGLASPPEPVLVKPYHLSFPFVFEHEGNHYLLPEQRQGGDLVLYRSGGFPFEWRPWRTLLKNFPVVDPVLHFKDDHWWLFCSYASYGNNDNNLHVFYSESLDGEFRPHPLNPVRSSLRGSRMAGPILSQSGRLLRPAQNCAQRYGGSIIMSGIEALSPDAYQEKVLAEIEARPASPFPEGRHRLCISANCIATDGFRMLR